MQAVRFMIGLEAEIASVQTPVPGDKFFATDTKKLFLYNGTQWIESTMTWEASRAIDITAVKIVTVEDGHN